ncbi:ATP-binding protein [Streptomyces flavalbus]|uniref:ATP-binding protein n=1 Tax=Streptomyces flavalbus TaxID=2665155 RepID=A0ABW2W7Q7_9ACTN
MPVIENVAEARQGVRAVLDSWAVPEDTTETVALIVTELAANAVTHAHRPGRTFDVALTCDGDGNGNGNGGGGGKTIEIEVHDPSPRHPVRRPYDPEATSGRGLLLVESLANAWEVRDREQGKTVWVQVVR